MVGQGVGRIRRRVALPLGQDALSWQCSPSMMMMMITKCSPVGRAREGSLAVWAKWAILHYIQGLSMFTRPLGLWWFVKSRLNQAEQADRAHTSITQGPGQLGEEREDEVSRCGSRM